MKKIGLAIALGKDANCHTRTFIEAVNYSLKYFPEFKKHSLKIVNDEKSSEGGERAAIELVEWGAEAVVGHFSSLAALSSLPIYSRNAIPLILPASTDCELDNYHHSNKIKLIRYQKSNAALMAYCIDNCIVNNQNGTVYALVQNNHYANQMMKYIPRLAGIEIIQDIPHHVEKCDTYIIIGYSEFACAKIKQLSHYQIYRIMLVDDSDSHDVCDACILQPQRLSRVRSFSHITRHGLKRLYWNETLLALSLTCSLENWRDDNSTENLSFNTYLGLQDFDTVSCYGDCLLVSEELY